MRLVRRVATLVLTVTARCARDDDWPRAMRSEMQFISSDWSALRWALGSAAAILRTSDKLAQSIGGGVLGIVIASAIAGCWMAIVAGAFAFFKSYAEQTPLLGWVGVIVAACAVFLALAARLWRTRKAAAVGLLAAGAIFVAHFALHVAANIARG